MIWPVLETLAVIEPHLPHSLISRRAFSYIKSLTQQLPDATSSYYLECPLIRNSSQVDLLACVKAANQGRERLLQWLRGKSLTEFSSMKRVLDFCSDWTKKKSPLHQQVPHIWLEFDQSTSLNNVPCPNILFCLDPLYFMRRSKPSQANYLSASRYQRIVTSALTTLLGQPISPVIRQQLFSCFKKLPPGGQLLHVSVMLARNPTLIKLNLEVPKEQFHSYLQRIGWTGSLAAVEFLLLTYCSFSDRIKFQLAITESFLPRVELEFHFNDEVETAPKMQILLERMEVARLCSRQHRNVLARWPGTFHHTFSHHSWPTRLYRWLDVKLVYHFHRPLSAKAYLGFMPSPSIF